MRLPFTKMHGAGNDFVMLDARNLSGDLDRTRIAALCDRRQGIGADGLIVVAATDKNAIRMTYYNADGGEAEMCGNGARCAVAFAHVRGLVGTACRLDTLAGPLTGTVHGPADIEIDLPKYKDLELDLDLRDAAYPTIHNCNTGVPHLVIPVDDIEAIEVRKHGRVLRHHDHFAPAGTNVNWIAQAPDGEQWLLRTYERGVEDETLACGTGAAAVAVVLSRLERAVSPVAIRTRNGDLLTVTVDHDDHSLSLRGPAVVAFQGEVSIDA